MPSSTGLRLSASDILVLTDDLTETFVEIAEVVLQFDRVGHIVPVGQCDPPDICRIGDVRVYEITSSAETFGDVLKIVCSGLVMFELSKCAVSDVNVCIAIKLAYIASSADMLRVHELRYSSALLDSDEIISADLGSLVMCDFHRLLLASAPFYPEIP